MAKKRKAATDDKARIRSIKVANSDWEEWQQAANVLQDGKNLSAFIRDAVREKIKRARRRGEL